MNPASSDHSSTTLALELESVDTKFELSGWDLSRLLPDTEESTIQERLQEIEILVVELEAWRARLGPVLKQVELLELLKQYEDVIEATSRFSSFASLWLSADTQASPRISLRNRVRNAFAALQNRLLFFELWWKGLDDAEALALAPTAQEEPDFAYFLGELRRFKPHTLDEGRERLINLKDANGIDAVMSIYSTLTNRMEFKIEVDGEVKTLTDGEMRTLFFSPDPDLRERVCLDLLNAYGRESSVLTQIYAARVRDWHTENVDLRRFSSPISVRNLGNDISDAAVDTLLAVVRRNAPIFQDYFRLKGEWLGQGPMRRFDLYAPLAKSNQQIPYDEAVRSVLKTFERFDRGFATHAERVFRDRHIDSEVRKGKRGGAFCSTVGPRLTPFVLTSFTGRPRDVATLAHELGHAVHAMLAEHHSILTQHSPLPLAETASVFSEILMTESLLARTTDDGARRELLAAAVDDIYATVMRQAYFVHFEQAAHAAIVAERPLDDLFAIYEEGLKEQFGDSMIIAPEFRFEWLAIPHMFNTPFYCYAYSFGQLLVLALYRRYQREGAAFVPGYLRLLGHGGSKSPADALAELDIDIADPSFWQGGFDVVQDLIAELKALEVH